MVTLRIVWSSEMGDEGPEVGDRFARRYPNGDIRDAFEITELAGGPRYWAVTAKEISSSDGPWRFELDWNGSTP